MSSARKLFGEVFTPAWLVKDMLNKLPEDVWTNPHLRWLDPCVGTGQFPSIIIEKLMDGLIDYEPDEDKRHKHIMENMIYVCEIQEKSILIYKNLFSPEYNLNIFHGSFLSEDFNFHMKHEWGIEKFDVIIGNPPYQKLKGGNKKSQAIWPMFVERGLELCQEGGLFSMIHPSGWRNVSGHFKNIQDQILKRQVVYLEMHDTKDGIKTFGATTTYDWYVIRNLRQNGIFTEIRCIDGSTTKRCLDEYEFVPGAMFDEIFSLIAKKGEESVNILHSYSAYETRKPFMSEEKTDEYKYPVVYTCPASGEINLWWSSTNKNGHFGVPKVIWSNGAGSSVHFDFDGKFGLTQFAYGIVDSQENLDGIQKAMCSEKFINLMKGCSFNGVHRYNRKIIALFRKDFWKEFVDE